MSHFAKVNKGLVLQVIRAEESFFESFVDDSPGEWIQCSYNTYRGVHLLGGTPMRKNFPGIGSSYDKERDAFIPPKPYPSWLLDEDTCRWDAPTPCPDDGKKYYWDEDTTSWVERE
tara:strand:+ start:865 stop:1212 length:348 start_codon:yes stop_codon:yes gene_type:complete